MDSTRFIIAGSFIDGHSSDVCKNVYMAVKDGIISEIGPAKSLAGKNGQIDDFSHCTIVPALVDCSASLSQSPSVDEKVRISFEESNSAQKAKVLKQHISYCHMHGVLGIADHRDSSVPSGFDEKYNKLTQNCSMLDIKTSGLICRSRKDLLKASSINRDFFKIVYSSNIGQEVSQYPLLGKDELCHIIKQKKGRKTVVIANGHQQVKEAIEAGCDAIEQGYEMGEENLKRMADKGILWIPNVLRAKNSLDASKSGGDVCCRFSIRYVAPGKPVPGAENFWQRMLAKQLEQLYLAKKLNVQTAIGSSAGSVGILHGESVIEEMKLFIKAGYTLTETFRCASSIGADFFGFDRLGPLSMGRPATFLITRGSAIQLPRKLFYLEGIYIKGQASSKYSKNPVICAKA